MFDSTVMTSFLTLLEDVNIFNLYNHVNVTLFFWVNCKTESTCFLCDIVMKSRLVIEMTIEIIDIHQYQLLLLHLHV